MHIYFTSIETLTPEKFNSLLGKLPIPMQDRVKKFRRWQDAYAAVAGKHLLLTWLANYAMNCNLHQLLQTEAGRPYFIDGPDFNISHSGNIVACIVSKQARVGIDIELMADQDISELNAVFTADEWQSLIDDPNPLQKFYHYWTIKEAVLKADGAGISALHELQWIGPSSMVLNNRVWNIKRVDLNEHYTCHIAFDNSHDLIEIKEIVF